MSQKVKRLKKEKDFERIARNGRGIKKDFLILKVMKNNLDYSRIAVSVSKKVSKKATVRNKIKRRIISVAEFILRGAEEGWDILLSALPGLEKKSFSEIKIMLKEVFLKAGIPENG
ncbi:MAG: ribonuclease P protein component [Patescibacteria group bacterium]